MNRMYAEADRHTRERGGQARPALRPAGIDHRPLDRDDRPASAITVMLASTRPDVRATWQRWLNQQPTLAACNPPLAGRLPGLATRIRQARPDVLLLDKPWFDRLGPVMLSALRGHTPELHVLLIGNRDYPGMVADVVHHRFHGFLPADCPPDLRLHAIHAVCDGELWLPRGALMAVVGALMSQPPPDGAPADKPAGNDTRALTRREREVVAFVRRGCTNKEIAIELGIMEDTVKKHLQGVFAKLGVHRRALVALGGSSANASP